MIKKNIILLLSAILINSISLFGHCLHDDPLIHNNDTIAIHKTNLEVNDSIPTAKTLQEKISELGAPPVNRILTTGKIVWSLIIILIGFLVLKFIDVLLNKIGQRSTHYRIVTKRIIPIVKILGWIFITYIIIQGVIRPPLATVIAFFTSVGVAVGFAAQDLLKNIFGGLMILFDRPFQIGG